MSTPTGRTEEPARPRVGEYVLLSRIGEGGMGVVHLAQKEGGKRVALKVLRPHIVGDEEARQRLAREVNSLSRIRSKRIAEILDADPWAEVPFVATRYVPGLSLHDHVREEGPVKGADLDWFATELAAALEAVHRVGVLHRDIKPSNVLMEGRNPVLIDFGLARVADDPKLTHTGWLLGTPGYLAPEILYGDEATPAADIHALASTIAFAGLGKAPFGRGPAMAVMDRVRRGQHDLEGLPPKLRAVLERALDPEPTRRPSLDELRTWLDPNALDAATRFRSPILESAAGPEVNADAPTALVPPVEEPARGGGTKVLPALMPPEREPYQQPPPPPQRPPQRRPQPAPQPPPQPSQPPPQQRRPQPPPPQPAEPRRRSGALRFRSGLLALGLGAVVTVCAVLAPWITAGIISVAVLLLRALSLAGSSRQNRRDRRGRHWTDGPLAVVAVPWYLLISLPGSIALIVWALILALSGGLAALAFGANEEIILASAGAVFAIAVYSGPGGSRVRRPLRTVTDAIAENTFFWLLFVALLAALATGLAFVAEQQGVTWAPADTPPPEPDSPQQLWDDTVEWLQFWK